MLREERTINDHEAPENFGDRFEVNLSLVEIYGADLRSMARDRLNYSQTIEQLQHTPHHASLNIHTTPLHEVERYADVASNLRNQIIVSSREQTHPFVRGVAEEVRSLDQLKSANDFRQKYSQKHFKTKYSKLSDLEKKVVNLYVIEASGRSNPNINQFSRNTNRLATGLIGACSIKALYDIYQADDSFARANEYAADLTGDVIGGALGQRAAMIGTNGRNISLRRGVAITGATFAGADIGARTAYNWWVEGESLGDASYHAASAFVNSLIDFFVPTAHAPTANLTHQESSSPTLDEILDTAFQHQPRLSLFAIAPIQESMSQDKFLGDYLSYLAAYTGQDRSDINSEIGSNRQSLLEITQQALGATDQSLENPQLVNFIDAYSQDVLSGRIDQFNAFAEHVFSKQQDIVLSRIPHFEDIPIRRAERSNIANNLDSVSTQRRNVFSQNFDQAPRIQMGARLREGAGGSGKDFTSVRSTVLSILSVFTFTVSFSCTII